MAAKLGIMKGQKLKPDAVPTIFEKQLSAVSTEDSSTLMSDELSRKRTTSSSVPWSSSDDTPGSSSKKARAA